MSNKWKMVRLGDVCTKASSNISLNKVTDSIGDYPLFGASGFAKNIDFYHQENEYIAIVKDGAGVGRVIMLPPKSSIVGTMQYILPKSNIYINYLCYFLKQIDLAKYASGATIPHIYFKDYSKEDVFLPPIAKQREIAEVLDKASELVEKRKAQLAELDLLAESVFYDMFGDPVTNPKGWQKKLLSMLYTVTSSKRIYQSQLAENGIPFYKISDLIKKIDEQNTTNTVFISEELYNEFCLKDLVPKEKDILITSRGTLGRCYIVTQDDKFYFQDGMISWLKNSTNQILNQYLVFLFNSEYIKMQINQDSNGATVNYLSIDSLRKLNIILPPIELQNQFARIIEKIEEQKAKAKEALKESENLFQRLMQDMFNPDYHNS